MPDAVLPAPFSPSRTVTPSARISAAIEILDAIIAGTPAEKALTGWARRSRFAGSGDRAAVRDHVYDALRCRRSFKALGGAEDGRGLMIGALRARGDDVDRLFTGARHAPAPLDEAEHAHLAQDPAMSQGEALDCPDWLMPELRASLSADFAAVMTQLRHRAPAFLRANLLRGDREMARAALAAEGIASEPHPSCDTALEVTGNAARIRHSESFAQGLVELQDASSQAVVASLPLRPGEPVLDYCAGGGGKTLALAARGATPLFAYDANPARMRDLAPRAARAGAEIATITTDELAQAAPFGLVLVDAPCSGSGSWRRDPAAKWTLTPARLAALQHDQAEILDAAAALVGADGALAYVTCSLLDSENDAQIDAFLSRSTGWHAAARRRITPLDGGDGFYCAVLRRDDVEVPPARTGRN